jgi:multidrug efflux system outer membrane protein
MKNQDRRSPAPSGLLAILLAQAIAGCSVGPNYQRPAAVPVTAAYKSATPAEAAEPHLGTDWWTAFQDPELNTLETEAIAANQNIQAALASVDQARAAAKGVKSAFYPSVSFAPSVIRSRTSATGSVSSVSSSSPGGLGGVTYTNYQLPFDLTYEVDIWGQVRRSLEAANAQVQFSMDEQEVVLQTVEADLAEDYFNLRSFDSQYQTIETSVETYRKQVELTQTEYRAGLDSEADVASAQALLDSTLTQQVETYRQRQEEEYAIAILINQPPANFSLPVNPLDLNPPSIPAGLPSDLLGRRPDVAAAEQNLASASAEIGVAISQYYPQLTLTGVAGFESVKSSDLLDWESRIWSLGPSINFPLFTGGRLEANVEQQRALYRQYLAQYFSQILSAYQDVENSLTDLHTRADEAQSQASAVDASQNYLRLTLIEYQQGLVDYFQVIDADRTLLSNQLSAEQILNERLVSTVLLIKALGGGWQGPAPIAQNHPPPPATAAKAPAKSS